jgi:hypothetical protein
MVSGELHTYVVKSVEPVEKQARADSLVRPDG